MDVSLSRSRRVGALSAARRLWTVGCGFYVLHVVCAFKFVHGWSHSHAYQHTAEETAAVTGVQWGGGLYFNYAFTALWVADAAAWWLGGIRLPYRSRPYFWTLHGVFAFMTINATVVFGPPIWKWAALAVAIAMAALITMKWRRNTNRR